MLKIKPHHFMDIIKLYGKGIDKFVPDYRYNHDFYSVANEIIENHQTPIMITMGQDDICLPCNRLGKDGRCNDPVSHIQGYNSKNEWNITIDKRIIGYSNISVNNSYSARECCEIFYAMKEKIFDIWREETSPVTCDRYNNFYSGAKRYLALCVNCDID